MRLLFASLFSGKPIAQRLIWSIVAFSTMIATVVTVLQFYFEYRRDIADIDTNFRVIEQGYVASVAENLWLADRDRLTILLDGITQLPDFAFAAIEGEGNIMVSTGSRPKTSDLVRTFPLHYTFRGTARQIGTLTVAATFDGVIARLIERAWFIIAANAIKTALVSLFIFFLVRFLITRHLEAMARHMTAADFERLQAPLELKEKKAEGDEIDSLVGAFNRMRLSLLAAHDDALKARYEAEASNRARKELMANISHELRTPLNAIIGFSGMMNEQMYGPLGHPKYREYAADIHDSGEHLLGIINDVLDVAAIEAGKLNLNESSVDMIEVADVARRMLMTRAEKGGVVIDNRISRDLPMLHADSRRMKQVMINLLSNAVKFTPENGKATISADIAGNGDMLIQVADTGIGMTPDGIAKALAPFGQIDSSLARKHEGTGLGLPLTVGLIKAHGGTLDIQSAPGHGTTVTIRMPAQRVITGEPRTSAAGR